MSNTAPKIYKKKQTILFHLQMSLCLSDMERSLMTAGTRVEQEELAFSLLEGFQAFEQAVKDLEDGLPAPGQVVPFHVPLLLLQVQRLQTVLTATSSSTGKEGISARAMVRVLDRLSGKDETKHLFAAAQNFDITKNPVAITLLQETAESDGGAKRKQKQKSKLEPETGSLPGQDDGRSNDLDILGRLWETAMSAFVDYQLKGPLTIFPLSTEAMDDRAALKDLLAALPEIERVYQGWFHPSKDLRLQWRSFVASEGAVNHPFSTTEPKPDFSGAVWATSILSYAHCPVGIKMACRAEHLLPDFDTLLGCMDWQKKFVQFGHRTSTREMLMFKEDKIKLVAMMMGEKVFRLVSNGHIDRLYPNLAFHEGNQFHVEDKYSFAIKLGLLFMLGRNFQTYTTNVAFCEKDTTALKHVFSSPYRNAADERLQAAFFLKHPPCGQTNLVPFVLGAISMKEYTSYEENPDKWIVMKERFLVPLDGLGQIVTQAKERVRISRTNRKRSRSSEERQGRSKEAKSVAEDSNKRLLATMTTDEYSGFLFHHLSCFISFILFFISTIHSSSWFPNHTQRC